MVTSTAVVPDVGVTTRPTGHKTINRVRQQKETFVQYNMKL